MPAEADLPDTGAAAEPASAAPLVGSSAAAASETTGNAFQSLDESTTEDGTITEETACAGLKVEPEPIVTEVPHEIVTEQEIEVEKPVALYIVLDNSGSMDRPADDTAMGGPSKWDVAVSSITDFVSDPASEGIEVAIQYFHPVGASDPVDECDGSSHAVSAVPIGPLPDNAANVIASLASASPGDDTPTVGSLIGGTAFCRTFQAENPDKQCVTVLVTDGQPHGCGLDTACPAGAQNDDVCVDPTAADVLTPIAAAGLADGVTTFTIGMAGVTVEGFALLNAIALAGGSDCTPGTAGEEACDVSTSGASGFLDALTTIRETVTVTETMTMTVIETIYENEVLPCEFTVPPPTTGEPISEDKVMVTLTIDEGADEQLPKAADSGSCAGEGWYFPDLSNLTLISTCPATCDRITAAASAKVDVLLGCEDVLQ